MIKTDAEVRFLRGHLVQITSMSERNGRANQSQPLGEQHLHLASGILEYLKNDLSVQQTKRQKVSEPYEAYDILPKSARDHIKLGQIYGEDHKMEEMKNRNQSPQFILDMPFPKEFCARTFRCTYCKNHGSFTQRWPIVRLIGYSIESIGTYFTVQDSDIQKSFPEAMVLRVPHQAPVFFTARFFWELCKNFYETFNARETRRRLSRWYEMIALHASVQMHFRGQAPYSLCWQVTALPKNAIIRAILLKGLATFANQQVQRMRKRQLLYNSKGLRADGNYKLAKRLDTTAGEEPCSVVLGICGTDGSLLDLLHPLPGEWWTHLEKVLKPLIEDIKEAFTEAGYTTHEARPVPLGCNTNDKLTEKDSFD